MSLSLNTIKPSKGSGKKRKRIGRGNASGHGTYAAKGMKGQRSRSGVSGLKKLGMRAQLLSIPKTRGFKSKQPKNQVINWPEINSNYKSGETVSPKTLLKKGLIDTISVNVKILGTGNLTVKGLKFEGVKMSESVKKILK